MFVWVLRCSCRVLTPGVKRWYPLTVLWHSSVNSSQRPRKSKMVKALLKPNFLDMIYIYIYQNHTTKIHRETVDFVLLYMYILPPFQKVTIHDSVKHGPPSFRLAMFFSTILFARSCTGPCGHGCCKLCAWGCCIFYLVNCKCWPIPPWKGRHNLSTCCLNWSDSKKRS